MYIEFKRISLHNFMSFGDTTLKFNDDGFIRVSGINENPLDNARSNGSGKSSLWEAIIWVITGETLRGTKQVVNIYGEDGCFVDIEFFIDNKQYRLIRSKDHMVYKTNLQIFIDGQDVSGKGIRDSEKLLQQYLPDMTASLIGSVIILGQGLPSKFTSNTPSGRKEVLENLTKSDFMIEDLKNKVSRRKTELTTELRSFEDDNIRLLSEQNYLNKELDIAKETLNNLDKSDIVNKSLEYDALIHQLEADQLTICSMIEAKQQEYSNYSKKFSDLSEQELNELTQYQEHYLEHIKDNVELEKELYISLQTEQRQLDSLKNIKDICPTCGQKIPNVHKPNLTPIENNIVSIQERLKEVSCLLGTEKSNYNKNRANIQNEFSSKKSLLKKSIEESLEGLHKLQEEENAIKENLSKYTRLNNELSIKLCQLDTLISTNQRIITNNNEKLSEISDKLMYNNAQKDLTQSHIEVVSKFETALKRDFRGYLLSTVISFIEQRAKHYSNIIFDTDNITFCLSGNNIDISYTNRPYENLSGGEKQKIDLIIQFSIRDMLSTQSKFTSNILVLDEVFDSLDSFGCSKVVDMIASISDIKNIFIVTHRKDLSLPTDKEVIVVKSSDGISRIN